MALHNAEDRFALHRASKDGNLSLVKDLLGGDDVKTKILKKDRDGDTVLHVASNADVLRFLLNELGDTAKDGICEPGGSHGRTVLHTVVLRKDVEMLMVLIDSLEDKLEDVIFRGDNENMTVLHVAAGIGNLKAIEIFLSKLGDQAKDEILQTDKFGGTVLHLAAQGGDIQVFKEITSRLSDDYEILRDKDIYGDTILHTAAMDGSVSIVEFLLERLGDEGSKDAIQQKNKDDRNVLHAAAYERKKDVLLVLLGKLGNEAKHVICEKDSEGDTVLHSFVRYGELDIIKVAMTKLGRQAPSIINEKNRWGQTVLRVAVRDRDGSVDIVNLILWKLGGHARDGILEENISGTTVLHIAIEKGDVGVFETLMDKLGDRAKEAILKQNHTILHAAVRGGNNDILKMLMLELGAEAENASRQVDKDGNNLLHIALLWGSNTHSFCEIVELCGRDLLLQRNHAKATPIHLAVAYWWIYDKLESLFQLMNMKVQEMKDILDKGRTLHIACELRTKYLVNTLLRQNTEEAVKIKDILAPDELFLGNTALHAAAIGEGDLYIFKQLLDVAGSSCNDVNKVKNWYGQTPLHFAVGENDYELVQYLIQEKGANPAQEDNAGVTSLHFAARSASQGVLRLISDSLGTDYNVNKLTGLAGLSPLHYAAWNGNEEAIDWLLGAEKDNKDQIDLEVKDKVEKLAPWFWSILGHRPDEKQRSCRVLKVLLIAHISKGKNPFTDDVQKFLEDHLNLDGELLDLACQKTLQGVYEGKLRLSPSLISCAAAYGDAITSSKLADELQKVDNKSVVQDLLHQSRPLEFAAMRANADQSRVGVVEKFLAVMEENEELHKQLESSFKRVLQSGDKKGLEFARRLVSHMRPSQVHALLQAELSSRMMIDDAELKKIMEDKQNNLRSVDKFKGDLVHDVPLAYWMARLHRAEQKAKVLHTLTSTEPEAEEEVETRSTESTANIIAFIKELTSNQTKDTSKDVVVLEGYPNNVGNNTGRTALHWAIIFGDKEIIKELCDDKRCKRDVVDKSGKPPYWYTTLHSTKYDDMLDYLKRDKYYENLQRDRDWYVDALNAILVGAALIATVTFSGVLQPPLQYPMSDRHPNSVIKYVAINRGDVQTFWVLNSLSFFFSMASALAGVTGVLPNVAVFDLQLVENIRRLLVRAAILLVISIIFVLAAFASAGLAVLPKVLKLQANMIVTTVLGGSFCVYRLWKFGKAVNALTPDNLWRRRVDPLIRKLWSTLQKNFTVATLRGNGRLEDRIEPEQSVVDQPIIEAIKRNSIRSHILDSGGFVSQRYDLFSGGLVPRYYGWDDGLWEEPFAKKESRIDISSEG